MNMNNDGNIGSGSGSDHWCFSKRELADNYLKSTQTCSKLK